jgi:hypothetical protein
MLSADDSTPKDVQQEDKKEHTVNRGYIEQFFTFFKSLNRTIDCDNINHMPLWGLFMELSLSILAGRMQRHLVPNFLYYISAQC